MKKKLKEIHDYDYTETTGFLNMSKPMTLKDLGLKAPSQPATQVVSIRLPTPLLNQIRCEATTKDVPYQALIKLALAKVFRKLTPAPGF